MRSEYFNLLLQNNDDEKMTALELSETDPEAACRLILKLHSFDGYGDVWDIEEAKLSTKWLISNFTTAISGIIDNRLKNYGSYLTAQSRNEEAVKEFRGIVHVVSEHAAYQGPIHYKNGDVICSNRKQITVSTAPSSIDVRAKALITHFISVLDHSSLIEYSLNSEELKDLLQLENLREYYIE